MVSRDSIEALRRAADELDWLGARDALDHALAQITPEQMLALAEAVLRSGLPTFERNHPGETWPRRALDGREGEDLLPECSGPGGNNFARGCELLGDARARSHDAAACRPLVVDVISAAIMGELYAIWGNDHRQAFQTWYAAAVQGVLLGADDPTRGWIDDPVVQAAQRALWNDVADRLASLA